MLKAKFNQSDLETEYKSCKKFKSMKIFAISIRKTIEFIQKLFNPDNHAHLIDCIKYHTHSSSFETNATNGTARMKDVRKELKSTHKSEFEYPRIIEMYDIITTIVTQMINVERLNSAQSCMDDKT